MSDIFSSDNLVYLLYLVMLVLFVSGVRNLYLHRSRWSVSDLAVPISYYFAIFLFSYFMVSVLGFSKKIEITDVGSAIEVGLIILALSVFLGVSSVVRHIGKEDS